MYITQDYLDAGLKMVNLEKFIDSLKLTWVNKLLKSQKADYHTLFKTTMSPISKFFKLGSGWAKLLTQKTSNIFWKEVFLSWVKFVEIQTINENGDILSSPLWYNPLISEHEVYFPSWFNKDIVTVGDINDNRGVVFEQNDIQKKFNFLNANFLEYHHIKILVNKFVKKYKDEDMFTYPQPCTLSDHHFNTTWTKDICNKTYQSQY